MMVGTVEGSDTGSTLIIVTLSQFREYDCTSGRALLSQTGTAQSLLRNTTFATLGSCNMSTFTQDLFPGVSGMTCGETYRDRQNQEWGVCNSQMPGACTPAFVPGTMLQSLSWYAACH